MKIKYKCNIEIEKDKLSRSEIVKRIVNQLKKLGARNIVLIEDKITFSNKGDLDIGSKTKLMNLIDSGSFKIENKEDSYDIQYECSSSIWFYVVLISISVLLSIFVDLIFLMFVFVLFVFILIARERMVVGSKDILENINNPEKTV